MVIYKAKTGFSLVEMMVAVGIVALVLIFSMPALRAVVRSFGESGSAESIIGPALASARAIAAKEQRYAGIRFQHAYRPDDPLNAPQYMIFIIYDAGVPNFKAGNIGCRVVEGMAPVKFPDNVGVMDLKLSSVDIGSKVLTEEDIEFDTQIDSLDEFKNTSTFSILFSPSGNLVVHTLTVAERNINDTVFNDLSIVRSKYNSEKLNMFVKDSAYAGEGQLPVFEYSRNSFIVYDKTKFNPLYKKGTAYSGYLQDLAGSKIYISPYTGTIMGK